MTKKNIFIGGAWPYANNSMHVGHLAALLPGDVIARYFRKNGNPTLYVSGSDCHGTPITLRAEKLGINPKEIATHYHEEFAKNFRDLGFSYDLYTNTMQPFHKENVQKQLLEINKKGLFYAKTEMEDFCPECGKYVSDREIVGICPVCGNIADGDQCDKCLTALTPDTLKDKKCKICQTNTILKENTHLYLELSKLTGKVQEYYDKYKENWRSTAVSETAKYLKEGLRDRAITRQLKWGVDLPIKGFEDKKVYVWIEAVIGYLSAGQEAGRRIGIDFDKFIRSKDTISYYSHGKDNIPFHTVILPALLTAIDEKISKPEMIVSCEYVNMNDEKMSKSKGNLITVNSLIENFDADSIRYYFIFNNPERKDSSFSLDQFVTIHNKHLVGGYGNFVNRNLAFLSKKFEGKLPKLELDKEVEAEVKNTYEEVGKLIEKGELKFATEKLYDFIQYANRYYDQSTPWVLAKNNIEEFNRVTSNCIYMIANMANLYEPILPKHAKMIKQLLGLKENLPWAPVEYDSSVVLKEVPIMFDRLDATKVDLSRGSGDTLNVKKNNEMSM